MSDLHGLLPNIEPCDLVILCGDQVDLNCQGSSKLTKRWYLKTFLPWAESLPCNKVIFIAGNHELHFRKDMQWVQNTFGYDDKVTYLEHELYEYKGLKIFGTPYCKLFGRWAFMYPDDLLADLYKEIPYEVDILITHDAPFGVSDVLLQLGYYTGEHIGNKPLSAEILRKAPKIVCHGHLHSTSREFEEWGYSKVINCSIKDECYNPIYDPITFEI